MGKIRTRVLGMEEEEQKQKEEQKKRSAEKKAEKKKSKAVGAIIEAEKREKEENETEVEAKSEKKEKKVEAETKPAKKHVRGKKYQQAHKQIDDKKVYSVDEAVQTLKKIKYAKFDEAVELHLNVVSQGLKGEVDLPHSTGKTVRVAIVNDKILEELEKGQINFDILITHPSFMPKLAKFAKVLGPKGLMPNPKAGTISPNPEEVAKKFQKGVMRWKTEPKFPLIHQMVGKVSHDDTAISENAIKFIQSVGKSNIQQAYIKTTMSPSMQLDLEKI